MSTGARGPGCLCFLEPGTGADGSLSLKSPYSFVDKKLFGNAFLIGQKIVEVVGTEQVFIVKEPNENKLLQNVLHCFIYRLIGLSV